jgi:hypothetical protein
LNTTKETPQEKRYEVPKYRYSGKNPPKPGSYQIGFVNREQRRLYLAMTAFNLAKVAAIVMIFLLMIGRL